MATARADVFDLPRTIEPQSAGLPDLAAAAIGDDGSVSVLEADFATKRPAWTYYTASGVLRWSFRFGFEVVEFGSSVGSGTVCAAWTSTGPAATGPRVACRDAATGALRWERAIADGAIAPLVRAYADGTVLVAAQLSPSGSGGVIVRFDPQGNELSRVATARQPRAITSAGTVLESCQSSSCVALSNALVRPDGSVVVELPDALLVVGETPVDAFATFRNAGPNRVELKQYDALGALRSSSLVDIGPQFPEFIVGSRGALLVGPRPAGAGALPVRYIPADGSAGWQRALGEGNSSILRLLQGGDLVVFSSAAGSLRVHTLSAQDGRDRVLTEAVCACGSAFLAVVETPDTLLRAVGNASAILATPTIEPHLASDPRTFPGAWFPAALAGEGIVGTVDPASNTLFAAWFTYATPFAAGEAGLRWYSLQGIADPSGTSQVTIYDNRGGAFAQPPITSAVAIGRATLRQVDCNRTELDYEFDGPLIVRGRRTLSRLTDPARCGGTPPAPRAGVDWRQTGAWFQPATAGQGVLFSIAPDAAVFGAWFTYDVAGNADDPASQQWLTMQSAGAPVDGSDIELDVYRTVGGRFGELPATSTTRIGTARLTLDGCSRATLRWQFDASTAAGVLSGRAGEQSLERLGACPP